MPTSKDITCENVPRSFSLKVYSVKMKKLLHYNTSGCIYSQTIYISDNKTNSVILSPSEPLLKYT